jgi:hypothetical protein
MGTIALIWMVYCAQIPCPGAKLELAGVKW